MAKFVFLVLSPVVPHYGDPLRSREEVRERQSSAEGLDEAQGRHLCNTTAELLCLRLLLLGLRTNPTRSTPLDHKRPRCSTTGPFFRPGKVRHVRTRL